MTVYFDKVRKDTERVVKIPIPIKYFIGADRFKFAIVTAEPGQEEVTDVAGGVRWRDSTIFNSSSTWHSDRLYKNIHILPL